MELLVGTETGAFVVGGSGGRREADGLADRCVRTIRRSNGSLFAGTEQGVFRSADGGRSWRLSGVDGKIVWDIAVAPDGSALYAGTQPAALFRSRDGGESWEELKAMQQAPGHEKWCVPRSPLGARARTIVLDPTNPARLWVGLEVGGILETTDDGATWSCTIPSGVTDIHVMAASPDQPAVMFATTGFGRAEDDPVPMHERIAGLFRSRDGGKSWEYLWRNMSPPYTRPMCVDPRPPHAVSVGCAPSAFASHRDPEGAKSMLYQSTDQGQTWRSLGDDDHSPSSANILAVAPTLDGSSSVLVGTDTGEIWRVSPQAEWRRIAGELPGVQAILQLEG